MSTLTSAGLFDESTGILSLTATSPINIALVKYWGKVHEQMIIPANSSLSITIDQGDLCSRTVVELIPGSEDASQEVKSVELILNGKQETITNRI